VESFRRIVRHLWGEQNGKGVSRAQLRKILREQIAGMTSTRRRCASRHLACTSHFFITKNSRNQRRAETALPEWVPAEERNRRDKQKPGGQFFDVLLHANAFDAISAAGTAEVTCRFGPGSATVVVGNPPWGYPKKEDKAGQKALRADADVV